LYTALDVFWQHSQNETIQGSDSAETATVLEIYVARMYRMTTVGTANRWFVVSWTEIIKYTGHTEQLTTSYIGAELLTGAELLCTRQERNNKHNLLFI